jgi:hypothetical protein
MSQTFPKPLQILLLVANVMKNLISGGAPTKKDSKV